jgi:hypothetical protein
MVNLVNILHLATFVVCLMIFRGLYILYNDKTSKTENLYDIIIIEYLPQLLTSGLCLSSLSLAGYYYYPYYDYDLLSYF